MNIYRLNIKRDFTKTPTDQVLDFISTWCEHPGLFEIGDHLDYVEMYFQIGAFLDNYLSLDMKDDTEQIHGLLIYQNGMGDFIQGYICDGERVIKVD